MYKKLIFSIFFLLISILIAQTSRFEKTFRTSSGTLLTGATIYIVNQSTGDSLKLTESSTYDGVYYRDNVPYGHYKVYVNGVLRRQNYFFAAVRERNFIETLDPDADNLIDGAYIEAATITSSKLANNAVLTPTITDSNVSLPKFSTAAINYIGSGGSITNNPDDESIINVGPTSLGVNPVWYDTTFDKNIDSLIGWINIQDYGAVGDGTTNDSAAFAQAYAAAVAAGKPLYMPKNYKLSHRITIDDPITIYGENSVLSSIIGTTGGVIPGSYGSETTEGIWIRNKDITIRDLKLEGTPIILDSTISDIQLRNLHFTDIQMLAGEQAAVYCEASADPGTINLTNIFIENCDFTKLNNTGAVSLSADSAQNVTVTECRIDSVYDINKTIYILAVYGDHTNSGVYLTDNEISDISSTTGRVWPLYGSGTPLNISRNQVYNITTAGDYGPACIRGGSYSYIIDGNIFYNIDHTASATDQSALISMKSPGSSPDYAVGIISNNLARECNVNSTVTALGRTIISNNHFSGEFERPGPSLTSAQFDTSWISNNSFTSQKTTTSTGIGMVADVGIFRFSNNEWHVRGGRFINPSHDTTATLYFINDIFTLDSCVFFEDVGSDTGDLVLDGCEINFKNYTAGTDYFFESQGVTNGKFIVKNSKIIIHDGVTVYSVMYLGDSSYVRNTEFDIDGSINSVFRVRSGVSKVWVEDNTIFDLSDDDATSDIFRYLASGGNLYLDNIRTFPKAKVSTLVNMASGAAADTLALVKLLNSSIECSRLFDIDDSDDTLRTLDLYNNYLDYTYVNGGSGAIETFNHKRNSAPNAGNGEKLYNSGLASFSGASSAAVNHYLFETPDSTKIMVIPHGSLGPSSYWVDEVGATTFKIKTDSTLTVKFIWSIDE